GAADRDTANRNSLCGAHILAGETGAGVSGGQAVASQAIVRESHRGAGAAIIDLIAPRGRDAQGAGADVDGRAGGGIKGVIACVGSGEADPGDADGLGRADGFVGETGAGVAG